MSFASADVFVGNYSCNNIINSHMNSYNSFVFTIDIKTIMTAQIALKQCVDICGFTTQKDRNKIVINVVITSLQDNGLLTNMYIVAMARDAAGRRTEAT